ncbi:MAG: hypothetical protein DRJ61_04895 [Acidobacteria bacterium]|nr:MAG: hypothetical protein DRJ61_04895 [Acidobacteriota bacterium]
MAKIARVVLVVMAVVLIAGAVSAQTSTTEIKKGVVVHVYGDNLVVRGQDGVVKEYDVPAGFQFNIDGKTMSIADLKPGMILTSTVTHTQTPHVVQTTTVKNAKVLKVVGSTVILRGEDGEVKKFTKIPADVQLTSNGKQIALGDLREGMNLTATVVSESVTTVDERDVKVTGYEAKRPKAAPVAPKPAPKAAPAPVVLPHTASLLPLAGLAGMIMLFAAMSMAVIRRF